MEKSQPFLANRDPEIQQTMARYFIWALVSIILGTGMYNGFYPENYTFYILFCISFLIYSIAVHISIIVKRDFYQRRFLTIIPDVSAIAISMYLTDAGPFSPFYVFPRGL